MTFVLLTSRLVKDVVRVVREKREEKNSSYYVLRLHAIGTLLAQKTPITEAYIEAAIVYYILSGLPEVIMNKCGTCGKCKDTREVGRSCN